MLNFAFLVTYSSINLLLLYIFFSISKFALNWPVVIEIYSVILSFAVCTITGIFFGWYPDKKASNLDPIEAIRYE